MSDAMAASRALAADRSWRERKPVRNPRRARKHDLLRKRFGSWLVVWPAPADSGGTRWVCRCDCGEVRIIRTQYLMDGTSKNCGKSAHWSWK